jgi:hypothetical protein
MFAGENSKLITFNQRVLGSSPSALTTYLEGSEREIPAVWSGFSFAGNSSGNFSSGLSARGLLPFRRLRLDLQIGAIGNALTKFDPADCANDLDH